MNKYGPITEAIMESAYAIAEADYLMALDIADILYDWYVKGLVFGINLAEES